MSKEMIIALALVKYGPDIAQALIEIFGKTVVTADDWKALFTKIKSKSYDDYVKAPNG